MSLLQRQRRRAMDSEARRKQLVRRGLELRVLDLARLWARDQGYGTVEFEGQEWAIESICEALADAVERLEADLEDDEDPIDPSYMDCF